MTIRPCAIAVAFSLLATAVSAETPPPASDNRPDAALEAFAGQVGVDLSRKAVLADLAATPRIGLPEIQSCLGDFDPHDGRESHEGHSHGPID